MKTDTTTHDSHLGRKGRARFSALCLSALLVGCLNPSEAGNLVPKTVDEDPTLPRIEVNGELFHAETFGDPADPVIIMLHGGPGGDYRNMLRLRDPVDGVRLEDRYFVVFWDQRGTGLSPRHEERELTEAVYDADLLAIADTFSPGRPVVLMGHSWGGMYATNFIAHHPERVAGAVLMDSGPFTGALFEEVKEGIIGVAPLTEWVNDTTWAQTIVSPDDHARVDYLAMLASLGDPQPLYHKVHTPQWRAGAVANVAVIKQGIKDGKAVWDFTQGLELFQRPVLFEGAERNEVIGAEFQRRQMTSYPNAELAVIAGAGHSHQWTHAEATLRPAFTYLDSIGF